MNQSFRQTIIGLIWPGPIAGPLPITLLRILSPLLVFWFGSIVAALIMTFVSFLLASFYFDLLDLTGGKRWLEESLRRLPLKLHENIEDKGPLGLLFSSLLIGVLPYSILLKLLKYPPLPSQLLLAVSALVNSMLWTGFFWGTIVETIKTFAF